MPWAPIDNLPKRPQARMTRGEVTKIFDRQRRVANFFLHLLKKEVLFCGFLFFFIKVDHPNYSMLEENLLAYFLYPRNTLFTGLSLLIKKPSVFIGELKTNKWTETELQLQLTWKPFKVLLVFVCKQVNIGMS